MVTVAPRAFWGALPSVHSKDARVAPGHSSGSGQPSARVPHHTLAGLLQALSPGEARRVVA